MWDHYKKLFLHQRFFPDGFENRRYMRPTVALLEESDFRWENDSLHVRLRRIYLVKIEIFFAKNTVDKTKK